MYLSSVANANIDVAFVAVFVDTAIALLVGCLTSFQTASYTLFLISHSLHSLLKSRNQQSPRFGFIQR